MSAQSNHLFELLSNFYLILLKVLIILVYLLLIDWEKRKKLKKTLTYYQKDNIKTIIRGINKYIQNIIYIKQ